MKTKDVIYVLLRTHYDSDVGDISETLYRLAAYRTLAEAWEHLNDKDIEALCIAAKAISLYNDVYYAALAVREYLCRWEGDEYKMDKWRAFFHQHINPEKLAKDLTERLAELEAK